MPSTGPRLSSSAGLRPRCLVSSYADFDTVLPHPPRLGVAGTLVAEVSGVRPGIVHDPNGARVELMDDVAQTGLEAMAGGTA
jgi:hypothetical protein